MDQFDEWDRFMEVYERSPSADRALATYKKERNSAELRSYQRDERRGAFNRCSECGREWWQEHDGGCFRQ